MKRLFTGVVVAVLVLASGVRADGAALSRILDDAFADAGYSVHMIDGGAAYSLVKGDAGPGQVAVTPAHMFRLASITKSYTAATVLRLVEERELSLSQPLSELVRASFDTLLRSDGYDTDAITLRHLLSHTAGLFDHAQSPNFINGIIEAPETVWTRAEHLQAAVEWGDPVGAPGESFFYSDTGYVLLGHIIERTTGKPLAIAVRALLRFDRHGLTETIWERGDSVPVPHQMRAHQFMAGRDTYGWDPSIDLYGGGGLVATPRDVARFYHLLMAGQVFDRPETLSLMLSADSLPDSSPYRLGVFERDIGGSPVFEHGGFWGTSVFHDPATGITVAGAALKQADYRKLVGAITTYLESRRN